jgi:hypothetical protein
VVADLIENLPADWFRGWRGWLARLDGITAPHPGAPREWRASFVDRRAARAAAPDAAAACWRAHRPASRRIGRRAKVRRRAEDTMIDRRALLLLALASALVVAGCESTPPAQSAGPASAPAAKAPPAPPGTQAPMPAPAQPAEARKPQAPEATAPMSIIDAQEQLTKLGYDPGPADGMFGPRTSGALRKFQRDHHLRETGTLDSATIEALRKS